MSVSYFGFAGHFLSELLGMVSRWHANKSCYESVSIVLTIYWNYSLLCDCINLPAIQECAGTPGFISMMRSSNISDKQYLDFENYRHITFKWHFKLTKSLVICLESKEYMQIRNGLILLTKVISYNGLVCVSIWPLSTLGITTLS